MKTLTLLICIVLSGMALPAQEQSPVPKISGQISNYFSDFPREKIFVMTDKVHYKPGETIWFSAVVTNAGNQPALNGSRELYVRLYDKKGNPVVQDIFRLKDGFAPGDLSIPDDLGEDSYYLVTYTSVQTLLDEISMCTLKIDPLYTNQCVAEIVAKDSISVSGQKNELFVILRTISGDIRKNTPVRYQLLNGTEIIAREKLKTDGQGKVTIPVNIPAKTNGDPFTCVLTDARESWKHEVFLPTDLDQVVLHFYPEGGHLLKGTPAKIGFTAFNKWGIPVDIEGSVLDQQGKPVTMVKTITKGLGLFSFVQEGNQKYKLQITGKTGRNQSFDLPAPNQDGLALSVLKTDGGFISANLTFADKQKHSVAATITHGTNMYWAADMEIDGIGRIKVPVENLPHGINLLSVFSKEGTLLADRLVFQDKKEDLKIEVQPDKNSLQPNQKMAVKVSLKDENGQPIAGSIMVSVTDKFSNRPAKSKIEECLLIGSELENPLSLITSAVNDKIGNSTLMDLFLIANRTKAFDWDKIIPFKTGNSTEPNTRNNGISGFVTDKKGNKMHKAKVSLLNNKSMQLFTTTTNVDGRFTFQSLNAANIGDFSAKATDPNGKKEFSVVYDQNFDAKISNLVTHFALKNSLLHHDQIVDETYFKNNPDLFLKAPRINKPNTSGIDNQRKLLMASTSLLDVIKTIKPYKILNNQIVFVGSENSINYQGGALIVLDGQQLGTDISLIQNISPMEVDHLNVSTNPMDIQRYTGLNSVGVIEIFLKNAKITEQPTSRESTANRYDGVYRIPNEFQAEPAGQKNDARTSLVWIPLAKTDKNGRFEFWVTSGKVISDFEIEVQGITDNGRMGSGKAIFSVTK